MATKGKGTGKSAGKSATKKPPVKAPPAALSLFSLFVREIDVVDLFFQNNSMATKDRKTSSTAAKPPLGFSVSFSAFFFLRVWDRTG